MEYEDYVAQNQTFLDRLASDYKDKLIARGYLLNSEFFEQLEEKINKEQDLTKKHKGNYIFAYLIDNLEQINGIIEGYSDISFSNEDLTITKLDEVLKRTSKIIRNLKEGLSYV